MSTAYKRLLVGLLKMATVLYKSAYLVYIVDSIVSAVFLKLFIIQYRQHVEE